MHKLDHKSYQKLINSIHKPQEDKLLKTYEATRELFIKTPLKIFDDILIKIGLAYSWMPTIPRIGKLDKTEKKTLLKAMQNLQQIKETELKELLYLLIPLCNNSIAGSSKVLHFTNPEKMPILDNNVRKGWNKFFEDEIKAKNISKIPHLNPKSTAQKAAVYMNYQKNMLRWIESMNNKEIRLRDLEYRLFLLGRKK